MNGNVWSNSGANGMNGNVHSSSGANGGNGNVWSKSGANGMGGNVWSSSGANGMNGGNAWSNSGASGGGMLNGMMGMMGMGMGRRLDEEYGADEDVVLAEDDEDRRRQS